MSQNKLKVYYGFVRIGVRKKQALSVIFENSPESDRSRRILRGLQHTFFTRFQTDSEADDAASQNRVLTEYSTMFDDKSIKGSLRKILESNFDADENHVSIEERLQIKNALMKGYISLYPGYKDPNEISTKTENI